MGRKSNLGTVLLGMLILSSLAFPAAACPGFEERKYDVFKEADAILRAKILNYEVVTIGKGPLNNDIKRARFTFDVYDHVLGPGSKKRIWKAWWTHSTFELPPKWRGPTNVVVGVKAIMKQDGDPDLEVVQQPCGPYSILDDSKEEINNVLDGAGRAGEFRDKYK